jgi:hypothetical protein
VRIKAKDTRGLARELVTLPDLVSLNLEDATQNLLAEIRKPDAFFTKVQEVSATYGVEEMWVTDENLESVFSYLVSGSNSTPRHPPDLAGRSRRFRHLHRAHVAEAPQLLGLPAPRSSRPFGCPPEDLPAEGAAAHRLRAVRGRGGALLRPQPSASGGPAVRLGAHLRRGNPDTPTS